MFNSALSGCKTWKSFQSSGIGNLPCHYLKKCTLILTLLMVGMMMMLIIIIIITLSALRHVHSLFQSEFSTEWDLVLSLSISSSFSNILLKVIQ